MTLVDALARWLELIPAWFGQPGLQPVAHFPQVRRGGPGRTQPSLGHAGEERVLAHERAALCAAAIPACPGDPPRVADNDLQGRPCQPSCKTVIVCSTPFQSRISLVPTAVLQRSAIWLLHVRVPLTSLASRSSMRRVSRSGAPYVSFLNAVGQPALKERSAIVRRRRGKDRLPLRLQLDDGHGHGQARGDGIALRHAFLR
jgi:hypothetical protein